MVKKVLIVSRRSVRKNKLINWVSEVYASLLCPADVMPVIVPIHESTQHILSAYLADYDGLLMVEGGDVNPELYGSSYATPEEFDPVKDAIETACFRHAYENNKPILGFCRGLHIINVMLGGTLHADVHEFNKGVVRHISYENYDGHRHPVTLIPGTPLYEWYQCETLSVNSYHHQGIQNLAPDLLPMAVASDGLIEAVYAPARTFLVGLQFHPERMLDEYAGNRLVFESFIKAL